MVVMGAEMMKFVMPRRMRMAVCAAVVLLAAVLGTAQAFDTAALLGLADQYHAAGRYLEALSFYRDVAVNSQDPVERAQALLGQAAVFGAYLGDQQTAAGAHARHSAGRRDPR